MYSVSEEYKKALLQKHITDTIEGSILLKDGTEIELDDSTIVSGSLRIIHELCDDYRIGTFNLGSMHIGFFDDSALQRDFSGARITLTYKIETENGWEAVPMGIFIADGQSVVRRRNTVNLTAYDYGILFDCTLGSTIRYMSGTAEDLISAACERCGVEFGGIAEGLPNTSVYFSPTSERVQSCRDLVGWCAAVLCGYAVIDRDGKLKIISARYSVDADDNTEIIIDKYLTSAERDSIYSTDTRGWIAQMSAYSGGKVKVYSSGMTIDDSQAARAVYYLDNNPLLENKSESVCDTINCEWLKFIDSFMQRGVTARIYGDAALDVGDILRCSEGDIDQRRSIVGLVTKQEWRYRDYHTVICASPQISDGFEDSGDNESSSEAQVVGSTDDIYPVKVVSQSEKRSPGKEYIEGRGIYFKGKTINLYQAGMGTHNFGGIRAVNNRDYWNEWTPKSDDAKEPETYNSQIGVQMYGDDGWLMLRTATAKQKGGFYLGDGFKPLFTTETDDEGYNEYAYTGKVELRLGDGLKFLENTSTSDEVKAFENRVSGRRVGIAPATDSSLGGIIAGKGLKISEDGVLSSEGAALTEGDGIQISEDDVISVKAGKGIEFDGEGNITAKSFEAGDGIEIKEGSDNDTVKVKVDGETVKINSNGELETDAVVIENAVIVQEKDASYILHEYTEIEYIQGNRIMYGGVSNPVICSGNLIHSDYKTAPAISYASFERGRRSSSSTAETGFYMWIELDSINSSNRYTFKYGWGSDSTDRTGLGTFTTYNPELSGIVFNRITIYPPTDEFPYGYVQMYYRTRYTSEAGGEIKYGTTTQIYVGFASEAEYNAAVGLTYEPNTLIQVNETLTEV